VRERSAPRAPAPRAQSGDRRSIDAVRTAPVQGICQNRQDRGSRTVKSQADARLARDCYDREQTTAGRRAGLFVVAGRRRGAVIIMLMGGAVRVDVNLAAVIVDADVAFGQAMRDAGIGGESEGGRRRENAKHVERGNEDRRFGAKSFGRY